MDENEVTVASQTLPTPALIGNETTSSRNAFSMAHIHHEI